MNHQEQEQIDPQLVFQALSEQRERAQNEAAMAAARAAAYRQELETLRKRLVELEGTEDEAPPKAPRQKPSRSQKT